MSAARSARSRCAAAPVLHVVPRLVSLSREIQSADTPSPHPPSRLDYRYGGTKQTSEQFNTAGRSVKTGLIANVIVSEWTWAATLLQRCAPSNHVHGDRPLRALIASPCVRMCTPPL